MKNQWPKLIVFALVLLFSGLLISVQSASAAGSTGSGSVSLTALGSPSTQNFDALVNTGTDITMSINGWYINEDSTGSAADGEYRAGTGSDNNGDTYSFGAAATTERALGSLRSGTVLPSYGASFTNNTGATIASLDVSYTGEMWRLGTISRSDQLDFQISTDAASLTSGTWVNYDDLDFVSPDTVAPTGAKDGNSATYRTARSHTITGLSIASGSTFWIRWVDADASGADDGLAIDDFSITPNTDALADPLINEFVANHVSTDTNEYLEVYGSPNTDYSAYTILVIEGDFSATATGLIDRVYTVGTTNAGGFWTTGFLADNLENGTITFLLVEGFSGAQGDDLDTNDDGAFDTTPWTAIADDVAVNDGGITDKTYAGTILTAAYDGGSLTPGGASRIPNGADTNTTADWVRNDFDLAGIPGFTGTLMAGEAVNTPGATNTTTISDTPPSVTGTTPADNATNIAANANITVTFGEAVNVSGTIKVEGSSSGIQNVTPTGGPTTFTLDPAVDFTAGETVTVTVLGSQVADQDGTPNNMAADYVFDFTIESGVPVCDQSFTPIYDIQGSGATVAITTEITTEGVVVGDYEGASPSLRGFYIQDATGDANAATSDGIFVFDPTNSDNVAVGDVVRITGTPGENQGQSQIGFLNGPIVDCGTGTVTPVDVTLPVASATFLEQYEGMLVRLPQTLYVTEHFQLGRFGQVVLSSGGRLQQPTNVALPGAPALALQADNNLNRIIVDDGSNTQNPDPILFGRGGNPLSASNTLRGGDTAANIVGVMTYTWAGHSSSGNAYRVRPINALSGTVPNFQAVNLRPASAPAPTGSLRVGGMNVLNYFNTFDGLPDNVDNCAFGAGGAPADCRGADTLAEFDRQWAKTVAALVGSGADVIGLGEIENDGYDSTSAIVELTDQMNAASAPGTYAYIDVDAEIGQVNALGTDAIKVGFIYKPGSVTPVGTTAALNTVAFVNGGDTAARNRPALAQAFEEVGTGAQFIVVANHLKSKGSACNAADAGDGQGNCNTVRTNAVNQLITWLGTDPTGTGDPDILIVGDLNSYAKEDPIAALEAAGYTNLIAQFGGANAYSYAFDGQWGYLDHALANAAMEAQVTGTTEWHINADEPNVLDYNMDFKSAGQLASLYNADEFRMSDHDLALVDLDLDALPDTTDPTVTINQAGSQVDPTSTSPINFTVVFSEPVTGFATGDVTLSGTAGATTAVVSETTPNDGTTYNVAVSGMTANGTVIATITADKAEDAAGNGNTASTSTDNTVIYNGIDTTDPDVTINQAGSQADPTSSSPINFTVVFNEPVTGFATGDVTLSGTAGATTGTVTEIAPNDGTTYNVAVSGMTGDGTVIASIGADKAEDAAGNGNTASTSTDNTVTYVAPVAGASLFVSTMAAGAVGPLNYGSEDILKWDGSAWSTWFDGSATGLTAKNAKHNINAFWIPDAAGDDVILSFTQNSRVVPGIGPKVDGMDLVKWDGSAYSLYFDGSDVSLTVKTQEKIDGLHIMPANYPSPLPVSCPAGYLLISTQGPGRVPAFGGGQIKFGGEDILGFCATNLGSNTAGWWHLVFDGSAAGLPVNAIDSISANADGSVISFTTSKPINVPGAAGTHSMVFEYDTISGAFSGPVFSAPAVGINTQVDGLHIVGDLP